MNSKSPQPSPMEQVFIVRAIRPYRAVLGMLSKVRVDGLGKGVRVESVTAEPLKRSFFDWLFARKRRWEVTVRFRRAGNIPTSPPPPKKH